MNPKPTLETDQELYIYYSIVMECMFVSPENSYAEALTAPRDGISEVMAPRGGGGGPTEAHASSGLEDPSCSPASLCPHVATAICKPGSTHSSHTAPASAFILDFQPPDLWELSICYLTPSLQ